MKISFLTLFPSSFDSFLSYPVMKRAIERGLVEFETVDIRKHTEGCFRAIDDSPYGGAPGLILRVDSLKSALDRTRTDSSRTILLGPKGRPFTQKMAHELALEEHIILVAGHFEGVDERFRAYTDDEISIGDYILTGGESAAIVVAEAVVRLLDGALKEESTREESFESHLLEYPQYTHPAIFDTMAVPSVLTSGNRKEIDKHNELQAIVDTIRLRPDLLATDQDFRFHSVHRKYGNEKAVLDWLDDTIPHQALVYSNEDYLVLEKAGGRQLKEFSEGRIIRTCAEVLRLLWSLDVSHCLSDRSAKALIEYQKSRRLTYEEWSTIAALKAPEEEKAVFSHGCLTLDTIRVNGKGLACITDFQKAGQGDRWRDLTSLLHSLEEHGIAKEALLSRLGLSMDEEKFLFYTTLSSLEER